MVGAQLEVLLSRVVAVVKQGVGAAKAGVELEAFVQLSQVGLDHLGPMPSMWQWLRVANVVGGAALEELLHVVPTWQPQRKTQRLLWSPVWCGGGDNSRSVQG